MDPHRPFGAPAQDYDEEADDASLEAHYGAEVRYFDRAFGELVEGLRARGVYRDLVIAFTSDHGEELSEARGLPGGPHGHSLHEELLHVPLVLKLPGNAFAGRRIDEPVSLIDLAPTLLGVAGIDAPESFRGTDLLRASPKTLRARTLYAGGLRTVPPQRAARHIGRKVLGRRTDLGDGEQAGWDWTAYDLEEDPLETRPRPLAAPPQWAESLDEEGPQGLSSPAGVEVDPGLRDALEALGYTE